MWSFFTKLLWPANKSSKPQAPRAQGQAQINNMLNSNAFGSDELGEFLQAIREADPQTRRRLGTRGRSQRSSVSHPPLGSNGTLTLMAPGVGESETENQATSSEGGYATRAESPYSLCPPVSASVDKYQQPEAPPSPGASSISSWASSCNSSRPQTPYRPRAWYVLLGCSSTATRCDCEGPALVGSEPTAAAPDDAKKHVCPEL